LSQLTLHKGTAADSGFKNGEMARALHNSPQNLPLPISHYF
jgi:hypothetical protein